MKKYFLIVIFLCQACSTNTYKKNYNDELNFFNEMSFEEYKLKLQEYANNNPYPNIDN